MCRAGVAVADAAAVAVVVHGRDQDAAWMREHLVDLLPPLPVAYLLPEAAGGSWYPGRWMDPVVANEPWLSWTSTWLGALGAEAGSEDRVALVGFSQGACVILDHLHRRATRYGAAAALTGGLLGPPGTTWPGPSLAGTPVFLGTSDVDEWVPLHRVVETADALEARGAAVELAVYPGMGHEICAAEVDAVAQLLAGLV